MVLTAPNGYNIVDRYFAHCNQNGIFCVKNPPEIIKEKLIIKNIQQNNNHSYMYINMKKLYTKLKEKNAPKL